MIHFKICEVCSKQRNLEIHHKKPRSRGGSNNMINLAFCCRECHRMIHDHNNKINWKRYLTKTFQKESETYEDYENDIRTQEAIKIGEEL